MRISCGHIAGYTLLATMVVGPAVAQSPASVNAAPITPAPVVTPMTAVPVYRELLPSMWDLAAMSLVLPINPTGDNFFVGYPAENTIRPPGLYPPNQADMIPPPTIYRLSETKFDHRPDGTVSVTAKLVPVTPEELHNFRAVWQQEGGTISERLYTMFQSELNQINWLSKYELLEPRHGRVVGQPVYDRLLSFTGGFVTIDPQNPNEMALAPLNSPGNTGLKPDDAKNLGVPPNDPRNVRVPMRFDFSNGALPPLILAANTLPQLHNQTPPILATAVVTHKDPQGGWRLIASGQPAKDSSQVLAADIHRAIALTSASNQILHGKHFFEHQDWPEDVNRSMSMLTLCNVAADGGMEYSYTYQILAAPSAATIRQAYDETKVRMAMTAHPGQVRRTAPDGRTRVFPDHSRKR